jgi:hypothetical protein
MFVLEDFPQMIKLSYSTMNSLILSPHTYFNKLRGLKTYSIPAFEAGKKCHGIIQRHVSGAELHPLLENLPIFSMVETVDFDPKMKFEFPFNDKYVIHGFIDGLNPDTKEMLEIKTGKQWSAADFAKLIQWKIYCMAKPEYQKIWLINTPSDPEQWNRSTTKVFNTLTTPKDILNAKEFIEHAIFVIENLGAEIEKEMAVKKEKGITKDFNCFYIGCSWCGEKHA